MTHITCRLTAKNGISSGTLRSVIEYGLPLPLPDSLCVCVCQSSVVPRCGRMVGFNAGNYHGVQAVQSGQRCAIAMWYTLDPTHREEAHDSLTHVLASQQAASVEPPPIHGEL